MIGIRETFGSRSRGEQRYDGMVVVLACGTGLYASREVALRLKMALASTRDRSSKVVLLDDFVAQTGLPTLTSSPP
jgi:hypothetical protein